MEEGRTMPEDEEGLETLNMIRPKNPFALSRRIELERFINFESFTIVLPRQRKGRSFYGEYEYKTLPTRSLLTSPQSGTIQLN